MITASQTKRARRWLQWGLVLTFLICATQISSAAGPRLAVSSGPGMVSYQGQVRVDGQPYSGMGYFKFGVVDATGVTSYWSNDGSSTSGSEPAVSVSLNVRGGLFNVLLGDTSQAGMTQPLTAGVFSGSDRYLRVWFSVDGSSYTQLSPDQRIASVPYALVADTAAWAADADKLDGQDAAELGLPSGAVVLGAPGDTRLTDAGYQAWGVSNVTCSSCAGFAGGWTSIPVSINSPGPRSGHTAVWTGTEMIIWGGWDGTSAFSNTGGRYNPTTNTWIPVSLDNVPPGRSNHSAVWTGTEMIVWGGQSMAGSINTGGRYNPVTDTWTPISMINAPAIRTIYSAIWTGTEMIVWGGYAYVSRQSIYYNDGGRYNPLTDTWSPISTDNAPAGRYGHTVIWTGTQMMVWGGRTDTYMAGNGGIYSPASDSWTAISNTNAPEARGGHTAVWTGTEMIIWGGASFFINEGVEYVALDSGGRYNPLTDTWVATSTTNVPSTRFGHAAVWTGTEMIIWGGYGYGIGYVNSGGRYNPATDAWTATALTGAPTPREDHAWVWTGSGTGGTGELMVWGGVVANVYPNDGGRYNLLLSLYQKP